jgi:hypothetical protein
VTVSSRYRNALIALEELNDRLPTESLSILLSGMRINSADGLPMDPSAATDWEEVTRNAHTASPIELIVAYLRLDASRYESVPADLKSLIDAINERGTPERGILESVFSKGVTAEKPY